MLKYDSKVIFQLFVMTDCAKRQVRDALRDISLATRGIYPGARLWILASAWRNSTGEPGRGEFVTAGAVMDVPEHALGRDPETSPRYARPP
jgi:hypothetical protein